jgi:hypothetical protein
MMPKPAKHLQNRCQIRVSANFPYGGQGFLQIYFNKCNKYIQIARQYGMPALMHIIPPVGLTR